MLGLFPRTRHLERNGGPEDAVRIRLDDAVRHGMQPDKATTSALVGLAQSAQLRRALSPGSDRKPTEKRMTEIADDSWGSKAVRAVAQV